MLWALDKAGYEVSDAERRIFAPFAMLADERRWFDRCAKLFTDIRWMPTEPPTTVTLGDRAIAFDDATWEEIVGAMVVDALSLTKDPNPIQADSVSAMGNATARRVASLVKHVGQAGPKWRASRRRRGSTRRSAT